MGDGEVRRRRGRHRSCRVSCKNGTGTRQLSMTPSSNELHHRQATFHVQHERRARRHLRLRTGLRRTPDSVVKARARTCLASGQPSIEVPRVTQSSHGNRSDWLYLRYTIDVQRWWSSPCPHRPSHATLTCSAAWATPPLSTSGSACQTYPVACEQLGSAVPPYGRSPAGMGTVRRQARTSNTDPALNDARSRLGHGGQELVVVLPGVGHAL